LFNVDVHPTWDIIGLAHSDLGFEGWTWKRTVICVAITILIHLKSISKISQING
jgi:hypothetical protein